MWTPLILFCMVADPTDCAIPLAPVARSEEQCQEYIYQVLTILEVPETMFIANITCYEWPAAT